MKGIENVENFHNFTESGPSDSSTIIMEMVNDDCAVVTNKVALLFATIKLFVYVVHLINSQTFYHNL